MSLRNKLFIVLLLFSVIALFASTLISQVYFYRSGRHLAEETEKKLTELSHTLLKVQARDFQRKSTDIQQLMETALRLEAEAWVESGTIPGRSFPPMAFSIMQSHGQNSVTRHIIALETGQVRVFPTGHAGPKLMGLNQLEWFRAVKEKRKTLRLTTQTPNGSAVLLVVQPIIDAKDKFLGAVALERPFANFFEELTETAEWPDFATVMLIASLEESRKGAQGLRVLAARHPQAAGSSLPKLMSGDIIRPDLDNDWALIQEKLSGAEGSEFKMPLYGRSVHWIFSSNSETRPFFLVLVPHQDVVSQATAARNHALQETLRVIKLIGLLLICIVLVVFVAAYFLSRRLTSPLLSLAGAAQQLSKGQFEARVNFLRSDEIGLLGKVFNQIGPALKEREQMASSLALAADLQANLLPQTQPALRDAELVGSAEFCDETGGDYYDFIPLKGRDEIALVLGDVTGHGIGAALLMASARGVLRTQILSGNDNLPSVFSVLNHHLCLDSPDEKFMTLFLGIFNARRGVLRWGAAGHGPILLYTEHDKGIKEFGSTGVPLGIMPKASWAEAEPVTLAVGDILFAGSDGIWEAQNEVGQQFGLQRLKTLLCANSYLPADEIRQLVLSEIHQFQQGKLSDDASLIVLKKTNIAAP